MIKRELAIFLIVGSLTVLIDFITYRGLVQLDLAAVSWAKGASFIVGTIFAYLANRMWTFGHKSHMSGSAWRFAILYTATLGANVFLNALVLNILGNEASTIKLAFLLATGFSAVLNFMGMKWYVFRLKIAQESS